MSNLISFEDEKAEENPLGIVPKKHTGMYPFIQ